MSTARTAAYPRDLSAAPAGVAAGDMVVARAWKYDGGPHWVVPGTYLGSDAFGHWLFQPAGAFVARPGAAFYAESDAVCLIPHQGRDGGAVDAAAADAGGVPGWPTSGDWVATFYDEQNPGDFRVYIDVSAAVGWRPLRPAGWEVHSIDMDLDVVNSATRGVFLDDEDEFEEHRVDYGYPPELVGQMRAAARELLAAVGSGAGAFAADPDSGVSRVARAWLEAGRGPRLG